MIKDNIQSIRKRIAAVCAKINKDPSIITIVAVSKTRSVEEIKEVLESGITDIGENRIQEAALKYKDCQLVPACRQAGTVNCQLKWHMVGHLQTNKVKEAVKIFDLIHSVDSLRLAEEIDKQAAKINKTQDILLEIKSSPEETKFGIKPEETIKVIQEISKLKNIKIKGLMTIAPLADNPEQSRPYFKLLRELSESIYEIRTTNDERRILSMGMTDDFEVAIEEGANMVRIGRGIFS